MCLHTQAQLIHVSPKAVSLSQLCSQQQLVGEATVSFVSTSILLFHQLQANWDPIASPASRATLGSEKVHPTHAGQFELLAFV